MFCIKERRKSRDDQKRDLTLLETREDTWRSQLEDKNIEIAELNNKLQVCIDIKTKEKKIKH